MMYGDRDPFGAIQGAAAAKSNQAVTALFNINRAGSMHGPFSRI